MSEGWIKMDWKETEGQKNDKSKAPYLELTESEGRFLRVGVKNLSGIVSWSPSLELPTAGKQ